MIEAQQHTPFIHKKPSSLRYFQEGVQPVDISKWKLQVTGEVARPLSISHAHLMELPVVEFHRRNVCVCLWSIKRYWSGVLLKTVLELAGADLRDPQLYIKQKSLGTERGKYDSTVHLVSAVERDAILAHSVDGAPLPIENGFPLRFIDFGLYLYKCVKCLTEIEITRKNEIGFWENYAGYSLDGTIQPKKYYAVDLQRKFYFNGTGEVEDEDL